MNTSTLFIITFITALFAGYLPFWLDQEHVEQEEINNLKTRYVLNDMFSTNTELASEEELFEKFKRLSAVQMRDLLQLPLLEVENNDEFLKALNEVKNKYIERSLELTFNSLLSEMGRRDLAIYLSYMEEPESQAAFKATKKALPALLEEANKMTSEIQEILWVYAK